MFELLNFVFVVYLCYLLCVYFFFVYCMINDVVQIFIVNVLLVVGVLLVMVIDFCEVVQFVVIVDVLLINVGILIEDCVVVMCVVVEYVCQVGKFWMLDLVVVGVLIVCIVFCYELLVFQLVIICGNVFEILVLVGMSVGGCGVDIIDMVVVVLLVVQVLVCWLVIVVVVIGEVDYVIDGEWVFSVVGGNLLMIWVVGIGCVLLVVVVVSVVLLGDWLENVVVVCGLMKQVGEIVVCQGGSGSFILVFFDVLYQEVQG